jgi:tetratricopeptide (TPR) repeat protein
MVSSGFSMKAAFISQLKSAGRKHHGDRRYRHAEVAYRMALRYDPDDRDILFSLAHAYMEIGRYQPAIELLSRLVELEPSHTEGLLHLARCVLTESDIQGALKLLERVLDIDPNSTAALVNLGSISRDLGEHDRAAELWERALSIDPDNTDACVLLGELARQLGKLDRATVWLSRALDRSPNSVRVYATLVSARCFPRGEADCIEQLQRLIRAGRLNKRERSACFFALGEAHDRLGLYDDAFRHARKANELAREIKPPRTTARSLAKLQRSIIGTFSAPILAKGQETTAARGAPRLIFIVGMPRSGTTLVEQVLASHPDVCAGGERRDLGNIARALSADAGSNEPYPVCLRDAESVVFGRVAQVHLERVSAVCMGAAAFTDKMPGNFAHLGLIRLLFPEAKIVHCVRHPLDVSISCFFQNFTDIDYLSSLHDIASYFLYYRGLMNHWHGVLGTGIHQVEYADLVASPERVIRSLLGFCGLGWDQRCLSFHQSSHIQNTASRWQVKLPIYSGSVGRWKNYEKYLSGVRRRIGGC